MSPAGIDCWLKRVACLEAEYEIPLCFPAGPLSGRSDGIPARRRQSRFARCATCACANSGCPLPGPRSRRGAELHQRSYSWSSSSNLRRHRRALSADGNAAPLRCGWAARGHRCPASLDACFGHAIAAQVVSRTHHPHALVLRLRHRSSYLQRPRRCHEFGSFAGVFFERKVLVFNSLAAAAFLLLAFDTQELFSTGFQLSFAVVATIILLTDPLTRLFARWTAPDSFLPSALIKGSRRVAHLSALRIGQASSVSLAAWVGSLVLILWYLNLVTPISLFANLAVVPIAFLILAVALLSLICAPLLPGVSIVFNNANWFLARLVIGVVQLFAQFPGGHYYIEHPHLPDHAWARMDVLDLGAGGAAHLRTAHGDWLFDCGSERDYDRTVRESICTRPGSIGSTACSSRMGIRCISAGPFGCPRTASHASSSTTRCSIVPSCTAVFGNISTIRERRSAALCERFFRRLTANHRSGVVSGAVVPRANGGRPKHRGAIDHG